MYVCVGARENLSTKRPIFLDIFYKILTSRHFDFNETLEHFLFTTDISVYYPKAYTLIARAIDLFKIEKNSDVLKNFPKQILLYSCKIQKERFYVSISFYLTLSEKEYFI